MPLATLPVALSGAQMLTPWTIDGSDERRRYPLCSLVKATVVYG